jgi:Phasin protein
MRAREMTEVHNMDREKTARQATAVQKEFLETYQEASRFWLDRMQSEMALWADLGSRLAKTRSVPEAFEVYGKCVSQQMQMTTEDTQHLLNDFQQVTQKIVGSLSSNGWARLD